MKLTKNEWLRSAGRQMKQNLVVAVLMAVVLLGVCLGQVASAQAVSTTTVQGTVYLANGQPGSGTLRVSWPAFSTANGQAIAADSLTVAIGPDGFVSLNLAPNLSSTPAGLYYTAVFYMSDGTSSTQYWVVPAAAQASLAQVQSQVMPAAQAVQAVNKAYVDQAIRSLGQGVFTLSGGTMTGPLYLNGDPTQALQAADKHYVDTSVSQAVPLAGGNMTGALGTPSVNGVQAPTASSSQTTLQAAMTAAGSNGAMEIPPTYAGTDTFTNPNGVRVMDLRTSGAQQSERSVKEFGAVCDGVTDDTNALQTALNYARTHGVALTIPQGTCKTRALSWHGESIGGMAKQVSALMGFPGQDVLVSVADSASLLSNTRIHDLTIYVDQSMDVSCSSAKGRTTGGNCAVNRPMESNSIFSSGGNGLAGTLGTGAGWSVGNCAIAMPAVSGTGGNGLRVAEIENVAIAATGVDPMAAQYPGVHSTHTCGLYLAQWPQWSEFRNIDIRGLNTGIAMPALPVATPSGLTADSNRWQNITIQATHGFTAAAGSNNVLDNVVALASNSAAAGETPTGLVLDLSGTQQGWTVRNAVVTPSWNAVQPQLTVTAANNAVTAVAVGTEHGLGFDPYGTQVPLQFSGSCTAAATASVNADGSIGSVTVTQGGAGCSGSTTASVNVAGTWDTAAPVNLIGGQNMALFAGNLLKGNGGYTVWNATSSQSNGTQLAGGGGTLPGGGTYAALVGTSNAGSAYQVDQFAGADFGAKLQACVNAVNATYGGTCDARNFTGTLAMGSNLTIATGNTTIELPCATIATANQVIVTAGTRNVTLRGCALRGGSQSSGSQGGTIFAYSGAGAMVQVGDPTYAVDTQGFHLDDVVINTTAATSATTQGLVAYRTQEMDLESLYFLGNANQTGMTLDGTENYTGGTYYDVALNGFQTAVNAIGHQVSNAAVTDWMNASTFVRLHINCPTSGGSPIAGTYGINLQQGDGNTITGGDVEGCATALHLGAGAQNNTIVGLRNENSTSQVVADKGSAYNNWITGGTMFTGKLTDNGTRNSFLDTFHRSFNGMNGDWYLSQQDATVTNHFRLGTAMGNERGMLNRYQTDYGYRWTTGLSDATGGEQFYQVLDELNNVYRLSIGQYNNDQTNTNNQTVINAAGTGAVLFNGSTNAGTGGVVFASGGSNAAAVATINNAGNAQFNGTLQVGGTSTFIGSTTVKNQADAEIGQTLWAGATTSQKESLTYKDWNGTSQWYALKDASNNWALNSATGGLDSFKAYQSTNSGDTYINASNSTGVVRVNYETGAGAGFKVYGGNSSALYASFTGTTSIQFPGLAAGSGHYCLQVDNSGYISNTGSACASGAGTNGTVNTGTLGQIAYYAANGTTLSGVGTIPLTAGGTGAATAAAALQNLGGISSTATSQQTMAGSLQSPSFSSSAIPAINVLAYGAKGDGVTDDTVAIQTAINAASCNLHNVYIPASGAGKCYKVSTLYMSYDATNNPNFCQPLTHSNLLGSGFKVYGDGNSVQSLANSYGTNICSSSTTLPAIAMMYGVNWDGDASDYPWQYNNIGLEGMNVYAANSTEVILWQGDGNSFVRQVSAVQGGAGHGVICQNCFSGTTFKDDAALNTNTSPVTGSKGFWIYNTQGAGAGSISLENLTTQGNYDDCIEIGPANLSGTNGPGQIYGTHIHNIAGEGCNTGILLNGATGVEISGWHTERNLYTGIDITGNSQGISIHGGEGGDCCTGSFTGEIQVEGAVGNTNTGIDISGNKFSLLAGTAAGINIVNSAYSSGSIHGNTFQPAPNNVSSWGIGIKTNSTGQNWSAFNNASASIVSTTSPYQTINLNQFIDSSANLDFFIDPITDYVHIPQLIAPAINSTGGAFVVGKNDGGASTIAMQQNTCFGAAGSSPCPISVNPWGSYPIIVFEYGHTPAGIGIGAPYGTFDNLQINGSQQVTGVHGTSSAKVQLSDGTGTSGNLAVYAADGSLTNGLVPPSGTIVGTSDMQTLTNKTIDGVTPSVFSYLDATSSIQTQLNGKASTSTTINGHALTANVTISASDLTTGTLPHAQLPVLLSADIPANAANTSGTAAGLSAASALPNGTTATTQTTGDNSTKVATTAYVDTKTTAAAKGGTAIDSSSSTGVAQVASGVWSVSTALPSGTTATTQTAGDSSTKVATTAYVDTKTTAAARGGTAIDSSASTGVAQVASGVWSVSTALPSGTTATTQTAGNNSTKVATTAYVAAAIPSALPPNGTASGDLSGSYPSPTVAKVNGAAVPVSKTRLASDASGHIVAAANTLGCLDGYDHLPCVVYAQSNVSESTPTGSYATVWTSTYAGTYRITGYIYGTTASSTAYTVSNYVKATQSGQSSGNGYLVASAQIGTTISSGSAYAYVFPLAASTAVQTESLLSSGTNTGGVWSHAIIVERLQ